MASSIIYATRSTTENQPTIRRVGEMAAQVFLQGTPVMIDTTGFVKAWDGTSVTGGANAGIAGFAKEDAANLVTAGVPKTLTYGTVANQPLAVNIPRGAPINDGRNGFESAIDSTIFFGQVGPTQTTAAADIGKPFGMTKDTDNHWYVDKAKVTAGTNTVVRVVKLDQFDPRGVQFVVLPTSQQIIW